MRGYLRGIDWLYIGHVRHRFKGLLSTLSGPVKQLTHSHAHKGERMVYTQIATFRDIPRIHTMHRVASPPRAQWHWHKLVGHVIITKHHRSKRLSICKPHTNSRGTGRVTNANNQQSASPPQSHLHTNTIFKKTRETEGKRV